MTSKQYMALVVLAAAPWLARCGTAVGSEIEVAIPNELRPSVVVAAPGRVEGASEILELGVAMDGLIAEIRVREGDTVEAGDPLVRLDCDERAAQLGQAEADLDAARELRRRLVRGSREEERRAARATTDAARASSRQARSRHDRISALAVDDLIVSQEELDSVRRDLSVAEAALTYAVEDERLVNAELLPEELARADAEVDSADQRRRFAEARVSQCEIAAPISGTVLRVHLQPGEQVSLAFPRPIISLADTSALRVRAEIDESDVGKAHLGQRVSIQAESLGSGRIQGVVIRIEPLMGRKQVRTGDPAEKSDRDVQEVLVELERKDPRLVVGLRVTAVFEDPA